MAFASAVLALDLASPARAEPTGTYFTGFELAPDTIREPSTYTEDGITVRYVGLDNGGIVSYAVPDGFHDWYPNGGGTGFTEISLADGGYFSAFSLLVATGQADRLKPGPNQSNGVFSLQYELFDGSTVVGRGSFSPVFTADPGVSAYQHFALDNLHITSVGVQSQIDSDSSTRFDPSADEALVIDDVMITAGSAAPEPSVWLLMLIGVAALGLVLRRASGHTSRSASVAAANSFAPRQPSVRGRRERSFGPWPLGA